jgi:hypothetical protein
LDFGIEPIQNRGALWATKMPSIDKAERRDKKRRKEREGKFQGVRYGSERAGEGLVAFETLRKTKIEGKPVRRRKRRGMRK